MIKTKSVTKTSSPAPARAPFSGNTFTQHLSRVLFRACTLELAPNHTSREPLRALSLSLSLSTPQTPEHPTGDGSCVNACDCGEGVPCGEYLFNHANGSMLRDWLINEHLLGPTGLGNPAISGFYVDDGTYSSLSGNSLPVAYRRPPARSL